MNEPEKLPRCGDHVVYRPTGEMWLTAYVDGEELVPAGLPIRSAKLADCDVMFRCSDQDHARLVMIWQYATDDVRRSQVQRLYGAAAAVPQPLVLPKSWSRLARRRRQAAKLVAAGSS